MPSDPRLTSALRLAAAVARMRAAEDWQTEKVEAGIVDLGEGETCFMVTITLRYEEGEAPEIGFRREPEGNP